MTSLRAASLHIVARMQAYDHAIQHFTTALDLKPGLVHALVARVHGSVLANPVAIYRFIPNIERALKVGVSVAVERDQLKIGTGRPRGGVASISMPNVALASCLGQARQSGNASRKRQLGR